MSFRLSAGFSIKITSVNDFGSFKNKRSCYAPVSNSLCKEHYKRCSGFSNLFLVTRGIQSQCGGTGTITKLSWKSDLLANPPSILRLLLKSYL